LEDSAFWAAKGLIVNSNYVVSKQSRTGRKRKLMPRFVNEIVQTVFLQHKFSQARSIDLTGIDLGVHRETATASISCVPTVLRALFQSCQNIESLDLSDTNRDDAEGSISAYSYTSRALIEKAVAQFGGAKLRRLTIPTGGSSNNGLKALVAGCLNLTSLAIISTDDRSPNDLGMMHIKTNSSSFCLSLVDFCLIDACALSDEGICAVFESCRYHYSAVLTTSNSALPCRVLQQFSLIGWGKRFAGGARAKQDKLVATAIVCPCTLATLVLTQCADIDWRIAPRFALAALASNGANRQCSIAVCVDGESMTWPEASGKASAWVI
jgi:hypothetical protein